MNGSYGYDGMNTERFMKIKFCDENQAPTSIISDCYRGGYKLNDSTWFIEKQSKYFNNNTPIQGLKHHIQQRWFNNQLKTQGNLEDYESSC